MIAKVCSQKNKNRDYFSSDWCIKTLSATCCLHRLQVTGYNCCRIDCVVDGLIGDWLVRGRVGVRVQCALCNACLCSSLCSLPCFLASKEISACTLSLCKQQAVLMVLMHQPLLKESLFLFFCEQTFAIK